MFNFLSQSRLGPAFFSFICLQSFLPLALFLFHFSRHSFLANHLGLMAPLILYTNLTLFKVTEINFEGDLKSDPPSTTTATRKGQNIKTNDSTYVNSSMRLKRNRSNFLKNVFFIFVIRVSLPRGFVWGEEGPTILIVSILLTPLIAETSSSKN